MTQEDKKLLLQDLCARLAFHCRVFYEYVDDLDNKTYGYSLTLNTWCIDEFNADKAVVKPYLRPMSSMTEEEKSELWFLLTEGRTNIELNSNGQLTTRENIELGFNYPFVCPEGSTLYVDWLNAHHFDYRGLISMGLAIEVTSENNPYKE